jgi:malate dehydrogenase (oxaloacetate-decarboxylating)
MTTQPNASYSYTVRVSLETALPRDGASSGEITALDVSGSGNERLRIDVTIAAYSSAHAAQITDGLKAIDGIEIGRVSDRTFLLHLGGKIEMQSKVPLRNRDDLSMAYTPGVARVCKAIADNPEDARRLTIKRNSIAVVTDGSAVLGLGNIGPMAALPVMEGKAALFKRFAGIDAWPICLDTQDTEEIIRTVKAIAPGFAGINLEDISAPRCFEIERRLREDLDIPVFHDDQHGTAIVVLAALTNALRVVGKDLSEVRIVGSGAGAAGTAIIKLLLDAGAKDITVADYRGVLERLGRVHLGVRVGQREDDRLVGHRGEDLGAEGSDLRWVAEHTNPSGYVGTLREALAGADVFIGVSAPNILSGDDIATMAPNSIVFALANPDPEVDPAAALEHAAVVATGRSDYPNQINNVLAFPGVFRGLLDAQSHDIRPEMLVAAARALADVVKEDELSANFIVPSVFDPEVASNVAAAVKNVASAAR